jgi:hypothetical protein
MKYIFPKSVRTSEEQEIIERAVINRALQCAKTERAPHNSPRKDYWYIVVDELARFVYKTDWEVFAIAKADSWHDKMDCQTFVVKVKKA